MRETRLALSGLGPARGSLRGASHSRGAESLLAVPTSISIEINRRGVRNHRGHGRRIQSCECRDGIPHDADDKACWRAMRSDGTCHAGFAAGMQHFSAEGRGPLHQYFLPCSLGFFGWALSMLSAAGARGFGTECREAFVRRSSSPSKTQLRVSEALRSRLGL